MPDASELEWCDPPPARRCWADTFEQLKARPGVWAKVGEFNPKTAHGTATRRLREFGCETTTRVQVTGRLVAVWARWPK